LSGAGRCARPSASKRTRTLPRHSACLADPNDEAISGHRLYGSGLGKVLWTGVVLNSVVIRTLEMQNRVHPNHDPSRFGHLTHHVVLLKECVVEVVAEAVSVQRFRGHNTGRRNCRHGWLSDTRTSAMTTRCFGCCPR
jgi:hypothetical protein